jgi:hypothetical protein
MPLGDRIMKTKPAHTFGELFFVVVSLRFLDESSCFAGS